MKILTKGPNLYLRTLSYKDINEVERIYRESPGFFELLAGVKEVPPEYVLSDMEAVPPNFDKKNKYFIGVFLEDANQMIGVADFLISYPQYGKGCFGLLLLSEGFQSRGYGKEAVQQVEKWAYEQHGVREITLGVELINKKAYSFWTKCNYVPTGEYFENTVMGKIHKTEFFKKLIHSKP